MELPNVTDRIFNISNDTLYENHIIPLCSNLNYETWAFLNVFICFALGILYGRTGKKYLGEVRAQNWGHEALKILFANNLTMALLLWWFSK
jgi:hypothetical protein